MILLAKRISVKSITPADDEFKFKRKSVYDVVAVDEVDGTVLYMIVDDDGSPYWLTDDDDFVINEVAF